MRTIKIKFCDFWNGFNPDENIFINILKRKYDVKLSDEPDYIFYSVFGYEHLKYQGIRIFYSGENIVPDFNICDYGISFNYINFDDRYLRFPLYFLYEEDIENVKKRGTIEGDHCTKDKFCNFIYSNGDAADERDAIFKAISTYKKVDSGGKHLNNLGFRIADKYEFQKRYKFSIAFENSSSRGYVTEKILQAFAAGTIPIYWGDKMIASEFNPEAFINCHDYPDFAHVLQRIIEIDNNDALFFEILNKPVFVDSNCVNESYNKLENFLFNIFEQEKSAVYRRNRFYRGKMYEKNMNVIYKVQKIKSFFRVNR